MSGSTICETGHPLTAIVVTIFASRLWKNITIHHTGISNLKWRLTRTVHELQYSFKLTQELRYGANITLGIFGAAV
jgi:hypothetical protein